MRSKKIILIVYLCVIIFNIVRLIIERPSVVPIFYIITYSAMEFFIFAVLIKKNRMNCKKKLNDEKNDVKNQFSQSIINEGDAVVNNYNITNNYRTSSSTFTKY